jgi:hypothetical protein
MFIGMTTALLGVSGLAFDTGAGVSWLVERDGSAGWLWSAQMIFGGLLMLWAAGREMSGGRRRACRMVAAFVLLVTWTAVGFHSLLDGADHITLLAPCYVCFIIWSAVGEAHAARTKKIEESHQ